MTNVLRKGNFSLTPVESVDSKLIEFSISSQSSSTGNVKVIERDEFHRRLKCELPLPEMASAKPANVALAWLALEYFFEQLQMVKVCVEVLATDLHRLEYYHQLGFFEEGRLSRHILVGDRHCDLILMAHFRETWDKKKRHLEGFFEDAGGGT